MKSYLKFLSRNKVYTFISVVGLAVSLMFVILLGDYAWRQFSIDRWHKNADRIWLTGAKTEFKMWPQAAEEIKQMCPEVESVCSVMSESGVIRNGQREVRDNENPIIMLADSTFFNFFDFRLLSGDWQTALDSPDKCVITEQLASQLFGDENPLGKLLRVVGDRRYTINYPNRPDPYDSTLVFTVSAVISEMDRTVLPNETQIILPLVRYPQVAGYELLSNHSMPYAPIGYCKSFLMLRPGATFDGKMDVIQQHLLKNYAYWGSYYGYGGSEFTMTRLTDVMFAPQNGDPGLQHGDRTRLLILFSAVLAILFFAVSNYINLTVANTGFRAKEMATRRLFGSTGIRISLKLIAESTLMVALSFAIGLALAFCFEQDAVSLFQGKIALANDINAGSVSLCLLFILMVGVISGLLPSWHLSRYQPIDIVRGSFRFRSKMVLSRVFIILQNVITVVMLTAALVIFLQLNHLIHAPLGFNTENLYYVIPPDGKSGAVRSELEKMPFVEQIGSFDGSTFINYYSAARMGENGDKHIIVFISQMDSTTYRLYDLKILRDYGNTTDGYYLTEETLRQLDLTDADREISWGGDKSPIQGIMHDFHTGNVLNAYEPFAIQLVNKLEEPKFLIKTDGSKGAKEKFTQMLKDLGVEGEDLEYAVLGIEETIAEEFVERQNLLHIISLFTFVAIVISVMGFVGMSLFFIRQRKKDIGIRKIMGSTMREVMWLMLRTFCMPLLVSFVIAVSLSYYLMAHWLEDFSYHIALSPWIFAATCAFSLLTAILSVGIQIHRAARINPVESIKTE